MCTVVIPRMNRKHAIALGAVLAASIVAWVLLHRTPAPRVQSALSGASSFEPADRGDRHAVDPRARRAEPPTAAAIAADAERSARLWMARADTVTRAKNARMFNEDVARLLTMPADEAWAALTRRANDDDLAAASAALMVATECRILRGQNADFDNAADAIDRSSAPWLPNEWIAFRREVDNQAHERLREQVDACSRVGGMLDFALAAMDRMLQPEDPETQLAVAVEIEDDDEAIAVLRELAVPVDSPRAAGELARRLMRSQNGQERAEGKAMLERLADGDPDIVDFLAVCFSHGCGGFHPGRPSGGEVWMERAAGMGSWAALGARIASLEEKGDSTGAWAWALYRLELATRGCFELRFPQQTWIGEAIHVAFAMQEALSPAQQAAGRALAQAIAMRWQAQATARFACD